MTDRAQVIAAHLAPYFAPGTHLLEIGAGKGHVARALREAAGVRIELVDVVDYNETELPLRVYDGEHLPFGDNAFDFSLLVFVLHHTPDPTHLLGEALRVSRRGVFVVENHVEGRLRQVFTRLVDSIPHIQHGVPICYRAQTIRQWQDLFSMLDASSTVLDRFSIDEFWQNFVVRIDCPKSD